MACLPDTPDDGVAPSEQSASSSAESQLSVHRWSMPHIKLA